MPAVGNCPGTFAFGLWTLIVSQCGSEYHVLCFVLCGFVLCALCSLAVHCSYNECILHDRLIWIPNLEYHHCDCITHRQVKQLRCIVVVCSTRDSVVSARN